MGILRPDAVDIKNKEYKEAFAFLRGFFGKQEQESEKTGEKELQVMLRGKPARVGIRYYPGSKNGAVEGTCTMMIYTGESPTQGPHIDELQIHRDGNSFSVWDPMTNTDHKSTFTVQEVIDALRVNAGHHVADVIETPRNTVIQRVKGIFGRG